MRSGTTKAPEGRGLPCKPAYGQEDGFHQDRPKFYVLHRGLERICRNTFDVGLRNVPHCCGVTVQECFRRLEARRSHHSVAQS